MESQINEQLREFIQYAYGHVKAVEKILDEAGLSPSEVKSVADLDKIPITSKDKLVELQQADPPFGGFLGVPVGNLQHIFLSPGPLYEPHAGHHSGIDSIREMLSIAGFTPGDVVLNAFSYHYIPTGILIDQVLSEMGATVIPAGVGNHELQVKMMRELKVTGYVGVPSWLMALLQKINEIGLSFGDQFSLEKALVSAEPLTRNLWEKFVDEYKLNVTNAYGTAELGFLAYNNNGRISMQLLGNTIIQVVNPETGKSVNSGETGEVVATNFNRAYPLIRLGTGDMAVYIDPSPGKSRQEDRSIILVGRIGDAVKVRGMFVHPNQLSFAVAQIPNIQRVQAVVTRPEHRDIFILRVLPNQEDIDREELTTSLVSAVQTSCQVKVDQVEFISSGEIEESAPLIIDQREMN